MAPSPILFCSHVVDWGGAERVLADLLATLDRERFAPHLLVPGDGPLTERARELEVPIETIPIGGGGPVRKLLSLLPAARAIRRVAERTGSDVCYANSMIAGYAGVLAQRERPHRLRAVWHVHIVSDSAIVRRAQRRARAVITPSREAAAALRRDDADVIENGVPDAFFTAGTEPEHATRLRRELGLAALETGGDGNPTPLVAIVGRIDPHKGHDVLLRACAAIEPRPHVLIVGTEAFADSQARIRGHTDTLQQLANTLGIADRTHFLGHRDDVPAVLAGVDVVVVPSTAAESAPRSIAEAQAAGRAVVASRIGGTPEMIRDGITGLLVPPGNVNALRDGIRGLLQDAAERSALGLAGREQARECYSLPRFAARVSDVLERVRAAD